MLMFCLSGIMLNHRELVADINIDRSFLPADYRYNKWNMGLLRGSIKYRDKVQRNMEDRYNRTVCLGFQCRFTGRC